METDGVLAEISTESFQECIGGTLEEVLKKNEKAHEVLSFVYLKYLINIEYFLRKKCKKPSNRRKRRP
jgi:hypothetical protein